MRNWHSHIQSPRHLPRRGGNRRSGRRLRGPLNAGGACRECPCPGHARWHADERRCLSQHPVPLNEWPSLPSAGSHRPAFRRSPNQSVVHPKPWIDGFHRSLGRVGGGQILRGGAASRGRWMSVVESVAPWCVAFARKHFDRAARRVLGKHVLLRSKALRRFRPAPGLFDSLIRAGVHPRR